MTYKKIILTTVFALLLTASFTLANPTRKTIRVGGYEREYLIYTPRNQQKEKVHGIIVCLHGFTRTMDDFFSAYNVEAVADSLNMIIVAPQALSEQDPLVNLKTDIINLFTDNQLSLNSVWGCGLRVKISTMPFGIILLNEELNKDVDDVDFINRTIDAVLLEYSLPSENIFILGTSMGGYMAYQFAVKKGERLSGLISIAGSMGLSIKGMDYSKRIPVCDFHSITDDVVPYAGSSVQYSSLVSLAMDKADVIKYWTKTNSTGIPIITEQVKYYPSTNGISVEKITYPETVNEVVHYKINNASHSYFFKKANGDCMDHLEEIAKFIKSHLSGAPTHIPNVTAENLIFYPNPVRDIVYFNTENGTVSIYDLSGRKILSQQFSSGQADLSVLKQGIYLINVQSGNKNYTNKFEFRY